jgi:hypothetical protein
LFDLGNDIIDRTHQQDVGLCRQGGIGHPSPLIYGFDYELLDDVAGNPSAGLSRHQILYRQDMHRSRTYQLTALA